MIQEVVHGYGTGPIEESLSHEVSTKLRVYAVESSIGYIG